MNKPIQVLELSGHFTADVAGVVNKGRREDGGSSFSSILSSSKGAPAATENGQVSHASGKKLPGQQQAGDDHKHTDGDLSASRVQTDASGRLDTIEEPPLENDLILPEQMTVQTPVQPVAVPDEAATGDAVLAGQPVTADELMFTRLAGPRQHEQVQQNIVHASDEAKGVSAVLLTAADTGRRSPEAEPVTNAVREAVQSAMANQSSSRDLQQFLQQGGSHQAASNILPASASTDAAAVPFLQTLSDSAMTMPSARVQVPVGQQGWSEAVGQQVTWFLSQKISAASLRLNPQHLGPMEMAVRMHGDQANVVFTSQHAIVRDALESSIPRLREMLAENGLNLSSVNVSQQGASSRNGQDTAAGFGRGDSVVSDDGGVNDTVSGADERRITVHTQGLVDYYA